jgi:hypothetical protein
MRAGDQQQGEQAEPPQRAPADLQAGGDEGGQQHGDQDLLEPVAGHVEDDAPPLFRAAARTPVAAGEGVHDSATETVLSCASACGPAEGPAGGHDR